ncbi:MAG TPA: hypothetical protein VGB55_02130 [Tepidisphaeraceae bacterium]|jgi:uncharacterized integral membrane protein
MNLWLKIRVFSKIALFSLVAIYLLLFIFNNTGVDRQVTLWTWFNMEPRVPVLVFIPAAFLFGVITTLLVRTIWRTIIQMRELKRKRLEKEAAAVVARAAKLRVREESIRGAGQQSL